MNTNYRFAWLAPLLALAIGLRATAQDAPTASGAILILTNDRVLEGAIERVGDDYRIRRGMGETILGANRAKRLCADWDDALHYMRSQANLGDPDERLRLARWCQQYGLKDQALVEARIAGDMRPTHLETKQLLIVLQRATAPAGAAASAAPTLVKTTQAAATLDLSADALALFTTKVQPILMNTCASCHANGQGGAFQLQRAVEGNVRAATQRNLASAVVFLSIDQPAASPLLVKSVSAHGNARQAPLRDRQAIPFQTLARWADQVVANNPQLRTGHVALAAPRSSPETTAPFAPSSAVKTVVSRPIVFAPTGEPATTLISPQQALLAQQSPLPPVTPPTAQPAATPSENRNDLYDPAAFNQPKAPQK